MHVCMECIPLKAGINTVTKDQTGRPELRLAIIETLLSTIDIVDYNQWLKSDAQKRAS